MLFKKRPGKMLFEACGLRVTLSPRALHRGSGRCLQLQEGRGNSVLSHLRQCLYNSVCSQIFLKHNKLTFSLKVCFCCPFLLSQLLMGKLPNEHSSDPLEAGQMLGPA